MLKLCNIFPVLDISPIRRLSIPGRFFYQQGQRNNLLVLGNRWLLVYINNFQLVIILDVFSQKPFKLSTARWNLGMPRYKQAQHIRAFVVVSPTLVIHSLVSSATCRAYV
jgi:hypothetical protein